MQIELQVIKKSSHLIDNLYRNIDIALMFNSIAPFVCLSADEMRCYIRAKLKDNSKIKTRILM